MGFSKREEGIKRDTSFFSSISSYLKSFCGKHSLLLLLLLCNALYYIAAIIYFPSFTSDDFYIFSLVQDNPALPVSLNTGEIFFLPLRPVSYFSFWLGYHIFGTNAFLMKLSSVALHLILVAVVYTLLDEITRFMGLKKNSLLLFLVMMIFSLHPDVMQYIIHINNRTELLMLLFYCASLMALLKFTGSKISGRYLIAVYTLFFLLSALSKQTGLHLPLAAALLAMGVTRIPYEKTKTILSVSFVLALVAVFISAVNAMFINVPVDYRELIYKKPLSIAGTLVFVTMPLPAAEIYAWFANNYTFALLLFMLILAAVILLGIVIKKGDIVLFLIFFTALLFYPRALYLGGDRINTHLVFWFCLALLMLLSRIKPRYSLPAAVLYLVFIIVSSVNVLVHEKAISDDRIKAVEEFIQLEQKGKVFPLMAGSASFFNEVYYYRHREFGGGGDVYQPLFYKYMFGSLHTRKKVIRCHRHGSLALFTSTDEQVSLGENPLNRKNRKFTVYPRGRKVREFRQYSAVIPDSMPGKYQFVFYNGAGWEAVK